MTAVPVLKPTDVQHLGDVAEPSEKDMAEGLDKWLVTKVRKVLYCGQVVVAKTFEYGFPDKEDHVNQLRADEFWREAAVLRYVAGCR